MKDKRLITVLFCQVMLIASLFLSPVNAQALTFDNGNNAVYQAIMDLNDGINAAVTLNSPGLIVGTMEDHEHNRYWGSFTYVPCRTGYTFAGWYDSPTGGNLVYNPQNGSLLTGNKYWSYVNVNGIGTWQYSYWGNMVLYAHWNPITYSISYDGNGADQGTMENSTHYFDIGQNLSKNQYIKSRTIEYADGINNSSTTMFNVATDIKNADFLGWAASTKKYNHCILSQYVTSVGAVAVNESGSVVINVSDTENVGSYSMTVLSQNNGANAVMNGNQIIVNWNAASCDPKIDLLVTVNGDDERETAYARYQLFGRQAVTVMLDYNGGGTGSISRIDSFLGEQYGSRLPTAKDVRVVNKTYTFVCWTKERNNLNTKVLANDYVSSDVTTLYAYYDNNNLAETPLQIFTYDINNSAKTITITGLTDKGKTLEWLVVPDYYWVNGEKFAVTGLQWAYGGTNDPAAPNTVLKYMYVSGKTATVTIGPGIDVEQNGVTTLWGNAFSGCVNLKSCYFGGEITIVPQGCFQNCFSLENVYIGNKVRRIEKYAFYNCVGLRNLLIPDSVTDLTDGMIVHNRSALGDTNSPSQNSALSNVYVSMNAQMRDITGSQKTYSLCPHQGYSIHTVFYSGCPEYTINSYAYGSPWWRYTLNNAEETDTGKIAPFVQMSAAQFQANFLNTYEYNDMLAGYPNRPTNAYEYEYINR